LSNFELKIRISTEKILELFASFRAISYIFAVALLTVINKVGICKKFQQKTIFETLAIQI
jgi:hypothetical protein